MLRSTSYFRRKPHAKKYFYFLSTVAFGLAAWQYYRYDWKKGLLADAHVKLERNPQSLKDVLLDEKSSSEGLSNTKIYVDGTYDFTKEIFVGPRSYWKPSKSLDPRHQQGYFILTPFTPSDVINSNVQLVVNRGWVPLPDVHDAITKQQTDFTACHRITSTHRLQGILRAHEPSPSFARISHRTLPILPRYDFDAIATSLNSTKPIILIESLDNGSPDTWPATRDLDDVVIVPGVAPYQHILYIFTWASLGGILILMTILN